MVDLVTVGAWFARDILGLECQHQRIGKRPGLGTYIMGFANLDSRLFEDLPAHGFLEGFARLDEAREQTVPPGWKFGVMGEQNPVIFVYEDDDGGGKPREKGFAAGGTYPGAAELLSLALDQCISASHAVPGYRCPISEGMSLERESRVGFTRFPHILPQGISFEACQSSYSFGFYLEGGVGFSGMDETSPGDILRHPGNVLDDDAGA